MKIWIVIEAIRVSVRLDDLLDFLLADRALLVYDFRAFFAQDPMTAWDHDRIDLASHADLALIVLAPIPLLLLSHHRLLAHHLLSRVDQLTIRLTTATLLDLW